MCEVCNRDYKSYRNLGDHRRHFHKLPFRQERLGASFQIDSFELHPENKNRTVSTATSDSVYVCQVCKKDYKTYQNLKYHRKHTHKIAARQEILGINFDIPTESLHPLPSSMKRDYSEMSAKPPEQEITAKVVETADNSIYVCEVCKRTFKTYRQLGDHRRCSHKLPFRQETLGKDGEISSYDIHPENKSTTKTAREDSVYVCEVCKNDYRTYQNLKYHRKHTHKLQPRQEMLGINGDIKTDDLHPNKNCHRKTPQGSLSEPKIKAQTIKTDSVYVCEVCKNDYKNYQNLKYHRRNTHGIAPRQSRLGVNGDISTDDLHPLKKFQKVDSNGEISVHPEFPKGQAKKHYHLEMYYRKLEKQLEILQQIEEKSENVIQEIESIQQLQALRKELSLTPELFHLKLKEYRQQAREENLREQKFINGSQSKRIKRKGQTSFSNFYDDQFSYSEDSLSRSNIIESPTELFFVETGKNSKEEECTEIIMKQEEDDDSIIKQEILEEDVFIKEEIYD